MISFNRIARWFFSALLALLSTLFIGGILWTISAIFVSPSRYEPAYRSVDASNLRMIGQASLIYAVDHHERLPDATDLPDYARQLALHGGLNDPTVWIASGTADKVAPGFETILVPQPDGTRTLDPRFAQLPHHVTLVLGSLQMDDPATTPLGWTRGLDLETGTWRKDSPYGGEGGHVLFLGGDVRFFRTLRNAAGGELTARDGTRTHRIRDCLPADARISPDAPPDLPTRNWIHAVRDLAADIPSFVRTLIMIAWPIWLLALFIRLTRDFASSWGTPIAAMPFECRKQRVLVFTPLVLIALSVLFRT